RFVSAQEQIAFAELVRRHGPMVLSVCRRVLHHVQDAEDAFQATFIVLARKATAVAQMDSVGGWLHGVAFRTALHAQKIRGRQQVSAERELGQVLIAEMSGQATENDLRELCAALDEAVQRLPEKYRAPIVLCYMEGKTQAETAATLQCSLPTIERRLAQARDL